MSDVMDVEEVDLDLIAEHGPFKLTKTGVVPTGDPTFSEWLSAFTWAQLVEKASPFWVGDLLNYGDRYGEDVSQALEASPYAEQTVWNAKYVAKAIPPERRRPEVPFSHHAEIASLPPIEQDVWLQKCADEGLTREQLRVQVKAQKAVATETPIELWVAVRCASLDDQSKFADRMKLEGRVTKLQTKELL